MIELLWGLYLLIGMGVSIAILHEGEPPPGPRPVRIILYICATILFTVTWPSAVAFRLTRML